MCASFKYQFITITVNNSNNNSNHHNNKKGQSNLALGGIPANWGCDPQISPPVGGSGPLSNKMLVGTTQVQVAVV